MSIKQLIFKTLLTFLLPISGLLLIYFILSLFSLYTIPASLENMLADILTLIAVLWIFRLFKPKNFNKLNSKPLNLKYLFLMIPISLLARIPLFLIVITLYLIISFTGRLAGLGDLFQQGVNFQWEEFAKPSGLNPMLEGILIYISVGILSPIQEELFFRGVLFNNLKQKVSLKKAFLITNIFFAFVHVHPGLLPGTFILGLIMTYVYYKFGNISYNIFLHMLINSLPLILGIFFPM